jgi:type I restriction-modification system DNA methylase subunit
MLTVKTNEREFMSQVISWLNEFLGAGTYPFELASSDPSVKVSDKKTKFPDVQIWLNRLAQQGFCGWELKTPATAVDDTELLENAAEKARAMNADYFVTWNMKDSIIWRTPHSGESVTAQDRLKSYRPLYQISVPDDLWIEPNKILLKNRAKEILDDLTILYQEGHLHLIDIDATYFVGRLNNAVKILHPYMQKSLADKVGGDAKFKNSLFDWAVKQGIARYDDPSFYETVSRQIVYRLLARILFYQTLRRHWSNLSKLDITGLNGQAATKRFGEIFEKARQIDWHAVFEEDVPDRIVISDPAIGELDKLIKDLNRFNFSIMPQDVIGAVFEKLIPYEERHALGQYFTRENLVDLINAFCVRTKDTNVLDPTCATGTFLTRAYDKMRVAGQIEHKKLLSQLWGIDIAHFPAELATINLFRQDLSDFANFPRIICSDFFEVRVGQSFKFPPPKVSLSTSFQMVEEKLPAFDAAVGNFPYIRQELINKQVRGYKDLLERTIKEEWLVDYPDAFVIHDKNKEYVIAEIKKGKKANLSTVDFKLSGQADIYAYLFFHTARFVKEGGRMGFVTSNAWLDVAYGYELQKFLLNNFKIIAILESRCEPWFEDPAINTIVTIVERCSNKEERGNHIAKFVKVKKKLSQLIPWDMKLEAMKRWFGLDALTYKIEAVGKEHYRIEKGTVKNTLKGLEFYEDDDFRIRFIKQGELLNKLIAEGKTSKWGQYLRAPQVYFDILNECAGKLIPLNQVANIRRGFTTGINEFFYLTEERIKHWGIEEEFLAPVIKSPKESESIAIDSSKLELKVFLCSKSKEELLKEHKLGALKYIEWGEQQVTRDGILWTQCATVKDRKPYWYTLSPQMLVKILWVKDYDKTFKEGYSDKPILLDQQLYAVHPKEDGKDKIMSAILNSHLFFLSLELSGRIPFGEGVLWTTVEEAEEYALVPDFRVFAPNYVEKIAQAFEELSKRPVKPIFEEVKMADRQKLDGLILQALGLDPKKYLKPIYDGLTELVRERIELANMRKKVKQVKTERDVDRLKKQVIEEVLPYGLKKFPEQFLDKPLKPEEYQNISVPGEPLKLGMFFLGTMEVVSDSGFKYQAQSVEEAKYIIYSQKPATYVVSLPKDKVVLTKAVNDYERYLDKLRDDLFQEFFKRTFDHKLADTLAQKMMAELGLPEIAHS